jgi:hypothetical protein
MTGLEASREKELVQLAVQEGHDADIPSNAGVLTHEHIVNGAESTKSTPESISDKDLEKGVITAEQVKSGSGSGSLGDEPEQYPNNQVGWDGDDDPKNPMNWPQNRKWGAVAVVAAITFLTPLGSSIFAPGVPMVMKEFGSHNELLEGFVVSVYVLGFAFGPLSKYPTAWKTSLT